MLHSLSRFYGFHRPVRLTNRIQHRNQWPAFQIHEELQHVSSDAGFYPNRLTFQ